MFRWTKKNYEITEDYRRALILMGAVFSEEDLKRNRKGYNFRKFIEIKTL